jgi:ketosteroid isomerase-like protein
MAGTAQDNEAIIRRGYEAFNSGDIPTLAQLFADDLVWHSAGRGSLSGDFNGRDATLAHFGQLAQESGGTFRAELHDVIANDEHAVGIHTSTGQRGGRTLRSHTVIVFHLRDGKVTEAWEHNDDTQAIDEFFA